MRAKTPISYSLDIVFMPFELILDNYGGWLQALSGCTTACFPDIRWYIYRTARNPPANANQPYSKYPDGTEFISNMNWAIGGGCGSGCGRHYDPMFFETDDLFPEGYVQWQPRSNSTDTLQHTRNETMESMRNEQQIIITGDGRWECIHLMAQHFTQNS